MDDQSTQSTHHIWTVDNPRYRPPDLKFHDIPKTMKQMFLDRIAEERRMKSLGRVLNLVLFGAGATVYINHFATIRSTSSLYPNRIMFIIGLNEVFRTISNGTFTSGSFLIAFGAPSFHLWILQSAIDICLFLPHLLVVAAILGKWVLGRVGAEEDRDALPIQKRHLHAWPEHIQARVLSSLDALPVILALSQGIYPLCWLMARRPLVGSCILSLLFVSYRLMNLYYQRIMESPM